MPAKSNGSPYVEVRRDDEQGFVHYGIVSDGAFHPFASERVGDYDERVAAAAESGSEG
jgi:hypothetical protein